MIRIDDLLKPKWPSRRLPDSSIDCQTVILASPAKLQEMVKHSGALESASRLREIIDQTTGINSPAKLQEMVKHSGALESASRLREIFDQTAHLISVARVEDLVRARSAQTLDTLTNAASEGRAIAQRFKEEARGLSEIGRALVPVAAEVPFDGVEWDAADTQIIYLSAALTLAALLTLGPETDPPTRTACLVLIGFLVVIGWAEAFAQRR